MSKTPKRHKLTKLLPKHERFVEEFLVDLNAKQAAIRAGYSARSAEVQGSRLIRDAVVAAAIAARKEKRLARTEITQDRVLKETAALAFSCVDHYMLNDAGRLVLAPGAPADAMQAVASVKYRTVTTGTGDNVRTTYEVEFKLWDKPGSVKLAGRHVDVHGFAEHVEVTGRNGGQLEAQVAFYIPDNKRGRQ